MIYLSFSLLILFLVINISIEQSVYYDFPYNKEFNIINEEKENNIILFLMEIFLLFSELKIMEHLLFEM